jgi:hypothetical protein
MRTRSLWFTLLTLAGCGGSVAPDAGDAGPRDALDVTVTDATALDAAPDAPPADAPCPGVTCGDRCCNLGQLCRYGTCLDDLGRCTPSPADAGADASAESPCPSDTYCDEMGYCTPYGTPAGHDNDPTCTTRAIPAPLVPATQCAWTMDGIVGTPVVADLRPGTRPDMTPRPSIVVAVNNGSGSAYTTAGFIHVFDGTTCAVQQALTDPRDIVSAAGTPAIGDLDMDGSPEIVAQSGNGGVVAFRFDTATMRWTRLWFSSMRPGPFTGASVALADLGGDAHPEVILGGFVYDWRGQLLDGRLGELSYQDYSTPVALADVDGDGITELIGNNGIYQLDAMNRLTREAYDMATVTPGFVAVADFGDFPGRRGDAPGRPEIVLYQSNQLTVRTIGGDTVFSANAAPIQGGGPPAVADLDGDGQPEIVVAGRAMMAFDPDCAMGATRGGRCDSGRTDGVLWTQTGLRDGSSAINGVTMFDFDGDGRVEVVEADECFVRIFDGRTGRPRWSAARFSCTFIEMPIVADVDGDLSAEIAVGANAWCSYACGLSEGAPDPILPGFDCASDTACPAGSSCRGGLCRCTTDAQCGTGNVCTPPLGMDDGMGNVCRSTFNRGVGLKVYGDARNRWVPSRPIWNQYSYSVTNVNDDATIPAASMVRDNWSVRGLNNYRQNTQGALGDQQAPNLTIAPTPGGCIPAMGGTVTLRARFCNRGTGVAGAQSSVQFEAVGGDGGRTALCTATAGEPVPPGRCVDVGCTAMFTPDARTSVEAVADVNDQVQECRERDNARVIYRPSECLP